MRHVVLLEADALPESIDEVFHFRERARKLVDRWHSVVLATDQSHPRTSVSRQWPFSLASNSLVHYFPSV